jgi:hypothetical protein
MALYELSIDAAHVREAERLVSLVGRGFPTIVMRWDTRLFDQPWQTTIVLDYLIALPPLLVAQSNFNEVKLAVFVGGAPTKFLYFGTEMNASVPRIAPEMENTIAPPKTYQEFRLEEQTCPLPYLKLIQATPRIYGNGAQDYYSPPVKVERYDGLPSPDQVADFFATVVAGLDAVSGSILTDSNKGFWNGARFVGVTTIAVLRQGKVVGLHRRTGRTDKDPMPAEIKRRDPKLDVVRDWVGIDLGAASVGLAQRGERGQGELLRIGALGPVALAADNENPSEISFEHLGRTVKAWRDRVILPITKWEDVQVGHAAHAKRTAASDPLSQTAATIVGVPLLRERIEAKESYRLRGLTDPDTTEVLKKPSPPIIDEDGIGSHDPFDPIELYAYYIGLHVNHRLRGIHLRYAVTMPTGWPADRRLSALVAMRRGLFRSLPAGVVEYHDLDRLEVVDAGPATIPFSVQAFRVFNVQTKGESVPFATIDAGASEAGMLFGILRPAKGDERDDGAERMVEYVDPASIPWLGGERLLHRLAYLVYQASEARMREMRIPIEIPTGGDASIVGDLGTASPEARANTVLLRDHLRPLLEAPPPEAGKKGPKIAESLRLLTAEGDAVDVSLTIQRESLVKSLEAWLTEGAAAFKHALDHALTKIGRDPDPYEGLHVMVGGRLGMHPFFARQLAAVLPSNVAVHRFKEPDRANFTAPTVKTACVLGVVAMRYERIGAVLRSESRTAFRYRVGRSRHGQLADALDPTVEYDFWREAGACPKPDMEILFMTAEDDGEVAADDPRVMRATCRLGPKAVGQRLYVRAIGPTTVEVTFGPPGGAPAEGAPQ